VHQPVRRKPFRGAAAAFLAAVLGGAIPAALAADPPFIVVTQAIASGSSATVGNSCSRLTATIGQPAPGFAAGGAFTLKVGFQAGLPPGAGDTISFAGLEEGAP